MIKPTQEEAFAMLAARLEHARKEHPVFAEDVYRAWIVIQDEVNELFDAIHSDEGPDRIISEALDVAATAMRLVMGEVEK